MTMISYVCIMKKRNTEPTKARTKSNENALGVSLSRSRTRAKGRDSEANEQNIKIIWFWEAKSTEQRKHSKVCRHFVALFFTYTRETHTCYVIYVQQKSVVGRVFYYQSDSKNIYLCLMCTIYVIRAARVIEEQDNHFEEQEKNNVSKYDRLS